VLKISKISEPQQENIEVIKKYRDIIELTIDGSNEGIIVLCFEISESDIEYQKSLIGLGLDEVEWESPANFNEGESPQSTHESIFNWVSDYIDYNFKNHLEEDRDNLHTEIMFNIESYCEKNNIKI